VGNADVLNGFSDLVFDVWGMQIGTLDPPLGKAQRRSTCR
jgi:hypothetical protein